jgi:type IV secretion system protein VirB3
MTVPLEERLIEDVLFLACTRPAMIFGVPMEGMGVIMMISAVIFLAADSLLYLLIAPGLWLVCREVCRKDPNAFRVLFLYVETKGRSRNNAIWGGSSHATLPLRRTFKPCEVDRG